MTTRRALIIFLGVAAAGCSSWWPFGSSSSEPPRYPRGATVYRCDADKELVVQYIDGGKSAMVILPERDFRLDRVSTGPDERYSNGRTTLHTQGPEAFVEEAGQTVFGNCKTLDR